jgi:hypothetical protein
VLFSRYSPLGYAATITAVAMTPDPLNSPAFLPLFTHDRHAQTTTESLRVDNALAENHPPSKKMHGFDNNISPLSPLCHSAHAGDLARPIAGWRIAQFIHDSDSSLR